jgi:hypothetical protein
MPTKTQLLLDTARARVSRYLELFLSLDSAMRARERVRLLSEPSVQRELKLTSNKAKQIEQSIWDATDSSRPPGVPTPQQLWPEHRMNHNIAQRAQIDAMLYQQLGAKWAERLQQIQRQVLGPTALSEPEVAQQLDLSQEQLRKVRAIVAQFRDPRNGPGPSAVTGAGPGADWESDPSYPVRRAYAVAKVLALLTPSQLQTWNAMIGPPFTGTVRPGPDDGPHGPPPDFFGDPPPGPQ